MAIAEVDVRALLGVSSEELSDEQIAPFMSTARVRLTSASAALAEKGITGAAKEQVALWLTCHYLALSNVGKAFNTVVEEKFEGWTRKNVTAAISGNAEGIMSTHYGAQANDLAQGALTDTTGRRRHTVVFC